MGTPVISGIRGITALQLAAVEFWLKDRRRSKARAIRRAGYSEAIAHQPHKVFNTPAVKMELWKRGLGVRLVKNAERIAVEDFKSWKKERQEDREAAVSIISQIPPDQIQWLKEKLAELPDPVTRSKTKSEHRHVGYQYNDSNDPFVIGGIRPPGFEDRNFSSM